MMPLRMPWPRKRGTIAERPRRRQARAAQRLDRAADAEPLAPVAAGLHGFAPGTVGEIPCHGGTDAALEVVARPPTELAAHVAGVDRVAPIVARTVGHEGLQRRV